MLFYYFTGLSLAFAILTHISAKYGNSGEEVYGNLLLAVFWPVTLLIAVSAYMMTRLIEWYDLYRE